MVRFWLFLGRAPKSHFWQRFWRPEHSNIIWTFWTYNITEQQKRALLVSTGPAYKIGFSYLYLHILALWYHKWVDTERVRNRRLSQSREIGLVTWLKVVDRCCWELCLDRPICPTAHWLGPACFGWENERALSSVLVEPPGKLRRNILQLRAELLSSMWFRPQYWETETATTSPILVYKTKTES